MGTALRSKSSGLSPGEKIPFPTRFGPVGAVPPLRVCHLSGAEHSKRDAAAHAAAPQGRYGTHARMRQSSGCRMTREGLETGTPVAFVTAGMESSKGRKDSGKKHDVLLPQAGMDCNVRQTGDQAACESGGAHGAMGGEASAGKAYRGTAKIFFRFTADGGRGEGLNAATPSHPFNKARWGRDGGFGGREIRSRAGSDPTGGPGRAREATREPYGHRSRARGSLPPEKMPPPSSGRRSRRWPASDRGSLHRGRGR